MRRISWALALLGTIAAVGCGGGGGEQAASGTVTGAGVVGRYYYVNLFTPPIGGIVTSSLGGINCGASGMSVNMAVSPPQYVYAYYGSGSTLSNHCGQTRIEWNQSVTLTATGQGGNAFLGWSGSCSGTGTCTLSAGADKTVVATFGPAGSGHPNYMSPAVHGPAYFAFLSGTSPLACPSCHGPTLNGQGMAPSCNQCHAQAGWTAWQSNCSFCHGARTPASKAGYALAAHPDWSAPPDAISQRLTGTPSPSRTGAHQAHLLGSTPSGLSVAPPFSCATCHPVPSDLTHVSGAAARAQVVLSGAGQASLPASLGTYSQASGTCATYCHGSAGSPAWSATNMQCSGCHGVPPPAPHPYTGTDLTACAPCHQTTMNGDGTIKPGGTHLDGLLQAEGGHPAGYADPVQHGPDALASITTCQGCHGVTFDGAMGPSCNACHASAGWTSWSTNCSFCHGLKSASTQAGYAVASHPTWSAPPDAIAQRLDPAHAAVPDRTGAHQAHLTGVTAGGQSFAAAFTCATCHAVPADLSHFSGATTRATVALSGAGQALLPASLGLYDQGSGSCATYCHGTAPSPAWATTGVVCGSCHALPPSTASGHPSVPPALTGCSQCHTDTMNADGTLNLASGTHLNGVVEAAGGHGDYTSPAVHGPAFFDFLAGASTLDCTLCHGATYGGGVGPSCNACHLGAGWTGSWQTNCSFCHGARDASTQAGYSVATHPTWSAPPHAIAQRLDPAHLAVPARTGAHQAHLTGTTSGGQQLALPFTCQTCHAVPGDLSHIGGSTSRATVALSGAGQASLPANLGTYNQGTGTCATSCHGSAPSPAWSGTAACGTCHALPPSVASGHPSVPADLTICSQCHAGTMNADGTLLVAGGKHVNGAVDLAGGHGDYTSPATHGPAFFDYLAGTSAYDCQLCHGTSYDGGYGPSCNACHQGQGWTGWQSNCSFCHGAKNPTTQAGYGVAEHPTWSAPPDAIAQRLDPGHVAVPARTGAHQAHLTGATAGGQAFTLPFTCATCHAVPTNLLHIGGSTSRATVALSGAGQASLPASLGTYDQLGGACATYCHGTAPSPAWATPGVVCGSCHALPPSSASGHPSVPSTLSSCSLCHPDTMNADGTLFLAGGKHVNGAVESSGMHGDYSSPATHGPRFFDYLSGTGTLDCQACHGATYDGGVGPSCNACHLGAGWTGSWQTNCSFCHGTKDGSTQAGYSVATHPTWSAPPDAIAQRLDPAHVAVPARTGAHQAHLVGATEAGQSFAPPFTCQTCHPVPGDLTHIGGSTSRATVALSGAGQAFLSNTLGTYAPATGTCATYCHGSAPSPAWSTPGVVCGSCHALPPSTASGHPNVSGNLTLCSICHPTSLNGDGSIKAGGTHLDGAVDASGMHGDYSSPATHGPRFFDYLAGLGSLDCQACHGATYDGGVGPSCNACHTSAGWTSSWQSNCSFCHGVKNATTQAGYTVAAHPTWSAPPDAIAQRLDPAHLAVPARTGAHLTHLTGTTSGGQQLTGPFTCQTCHAVPGDLTHIGGSASRATVALSGAGQANLLGNLGTYTQASGACASYCHGASLPGGTRNPVFWTDTSLACNACHFIASPPPPHPANDALGAAITSAPQCSQCHPDTVNSDGTIKVAGGLHVNGVLDGGGHAAGYAAAAVHGPDFFASLRGTGAACASCHGATYDGGSGPSCNACHLGAGWTGSWKTNCSFCHGTRNATTMAGYTLASHPTWSAPPDALSQRLNGAPAPTRTGAHQTHLTGLGSSSGSAYVTVPFACSTCHAVPADYAHAGGPGRAPVTLVGTGGLPANLGTYSQATGTCTTYCHGSTLGGGNPAPVWQGGELGCTGCHGYAPSSGQHDFHVNGNGNWCADCHSTSVDFSNVIGAAHLNGTKNVNYYSPGSTWDGFGCTASCHEFTSDYRSW